MVMVIGVAAMIVRTIVLVTMREVMNCGLSCRGYTSSVIVSEGANGNMFAVLVYHIFVGVRMTGMSSRIRHEESRREFSQHGFDFFLIESLQQLTYKLTKTV